jgi:hypothetical protein
VPKPFRQIQFVPHSVSRRHYCCGTAEESARLVASEHSVRATLSAMLRPNGLVVETNTVWRECPQHNGPATSRVAVDTDYFSVCDQAAA